MILLTSLDSGAFILGSAGLIDYFIDSNNAGKVVICLLVVMNCYALSLMWSKHQLFKKVNTKNARDEKRINDLDNIFQYDDALFSGGGSPYLKICSRAMAAARRTNDKGSIRMNYVENAIKRALSEVGEEYEAKMYWLATIVSGAPFLGLLGTVWGVMDAFGTMESGGGQQLSTLPQGSRGHFLPQLQPCAWRFQLYLHTMDCWGRLDPA